MRCGPKENGRAAGAEVPGKEELPILSFVFWPRSKSGFAGAFIRRAEARG